jgi:hypothetical protein
MLNLVFDLLIVSSLWTIATADEAPEPLEVPWSTKTFGPDGPWQAVEVGIGTPEQKLALYPGGVWESNILTTQICQDPSSPTCYANQAGLFLMDDSSSLDNTSISGISWDGDMTYGLNGVPQYGRAQQSFDDIDIGGHSIPNVSLRTINSISQTYPGGQTYPVELGILSLGSHNLNQTFSENPPTPAINTTFVNSYLYTSKSIPSYSYGLHIGSVPFNIPGSLFLGGYDQSRALAPVSAQAFNSDQFPIELIDVGLGVARGASPWHFANKTDLLAQGNSSIGQTLSVLVSPTDPYIYLPQSTCDAIVADLPVEFQSALGLYFWNTSSPAYAKIVTSPAYLAFTFQLNSLNTANFTINVPFAMLNLTLDAPLVSTPTPYFPCFPTNGTYGLGRAFLQAAFVGVNWGSGTGNWFLAQAPGPNYQTNPSLTNIDPKATTIAGSQSSWLESWKGHWTPLPTTGGNVPGGSDTSGSGGSSGNGNGNGSGSGDGSSSGLSSGAKAGIGVGVGVGGLALLSALGFFFLRRRRQQQATQAEGEPLQGTSQAGGGPVEAYTDKDANKQTYPYYGGPQPAPVELDNQNRTVHELQ